MNDLTSLVVPIAYHGLIDTSQAMQVCMYGVSFIHTIKF